MAVAANNTGIIVLGGGVAKHHICNANAFVSIFNPKRQPVGMYMTKSSKVSEEDLVLWLYQ